MGFQLWKYVILYDSRVEIWVQIFLNEVWNHVSLTDDKLSVGFLLYYYMGFCIYFTFIYAIHNRGPLHCRQILYQMSYSRSLYMCVCVICQILEKATAPHSSALAWKIPWTEEPGRLQSMGSLTVGHDWVTSLSIFTFHFHALEKEMATHSSVLAWRIPRTGEPGGLPSMGSHRVRHDWSNLAAAAAAAAWKSTELYL